MSFLGLSWYVAPDGSPRGDGTRERPWDVGTALAHPAEVEPGDIVWVKGGSYELSGSLESRLVGEPGRPIVVRADPDDDAAVLDFAGSGDPWGLNLQGRDAWFWGLELTNSSRIRWSDTPGAPGDPRGTGVFSEAGPGTKLINLVVHEFGTSLFESQPHGLEVHGGLFFNSYWDGPDRSHGPGLYVRNPAGAPRKRIENNFVFQHGRQGLQGFGSTPFANVDVVGNVFFNNGIGRNGFHRNLMFGNGSDEHRDLLFEDNVGYFPQGEATGTEFNLFGGDGGCHDVRLIRNTFAHRGREAVKIQRCDGELLRSNRFVGGVDYSSFDGEVSVRGEEFRRRFRPNKYFDDTVRPPKGVWRRVCENRFLPDAWDHRAISHVSVVNWDRRQMVEVDLSELPSVGHLPSDGTVRVRSVQNLGQEVWATCADGMVAIPMTGWRAAAPAGRSLATDPLPETFPEFGAFLIDWPVGGIDRGEKEPLPDEDPGVGLSEADARAARERAWSVSDLAVREQLREVRRRAWRAQSLGRLES